MLLAQVRRSLLEACTLSFADRIVVGVSGGPDSICLLDLLARLDMSLVAATLDHGLRPESREETEHVRRFAASLGVEVVIGQRDVPAYAAETGCSLEQAARELRYRFLFQVAADRQASAVAVGHTADDQAETVIMNLLRGAGLRGLTGMRPRVILETFSSDRPLVRPLLAVWRTEVEAYCRAHNLPTLKDPSNEDLAFTRNRVRHELIPILERYNPQVRQALWRLSEAAAGERALADVAFIDLQRELVERQGEGWTGLAFGGLRTLPPLIGRTVLHRVLSGLQKEAGPVDFNAAARAWAYVQGAAGAGPLDLGGGLHVRKEEGRVWVYRQGVALPFGSWPQLLAPDGQPLGVPGSVELAEGWQLSATPALPASGVAEVLGRPVPQNRAWLDASSLTAPLTVRGRKRGDVLHPLGLDGKRQKLSDFMINEKIPRRARDRWPLVVCGGEIVWVAGRRLAHPFRLKNDTRDAVLLRLHRPENSS